ncbi:Arm DNA-binding domain-containing protein [Pseudomonas sp. NFACC13-1]|uniref:Arm DNA-binding domain-containing protein n=1 Tax=Pseudomonas sp. NFACC13-1 TaxID=1566245 RepID=UPI00210C2B8D|nr:Arm DNA-binding domain-containing protein [Pseudomonas sp. NFACC13-1]
MLSTRPKEKLYRFNDQHGLYLEIKPTSVKAWRYRFALNGKSSMIGLGDYPIVRLSEAHERSEAARKLVKEGVNPAQQRQLDRIRHANEATNTFDVRFRQKNRRVNQPNC